MDFAKTDSTYLGVAPVTERGGRRTYDREGLRFAPEFGGTEDDMSYVDYGIPGGISTGQDPTGLSYAPVDSGWIDRWDWTTDELTVDEFQALDGDVDVYDDVNEPDEYMSMVAGGFGALQSHPGMVPAMPASPYGPAPMLRPMPSRRPGRRPSRRPRRPSRRPRQPQMMQPGTPMLQPGQAAPMPMPAPAGSRRPKVKWQKTILAALTNVATFTAATGSVTTLQQTVVIRPQFDFVAQDVVFEPTDAIRVAQAAAVALTGAFCNQIVFGDYIVYTNAVGTPVQIFSSSANAGGSSFIRGIVKGAKIRGGLDIQVALTWVVAGPTTAASVTGVNIQISTVFVGLKPQTGPCA